MLTQLCAFGAWPECELWYRQHNFSSSPLRCKVVPPWCLHVQHIPQMLDRAHLEVKWTQSIPEHSQCSRVQYPAERGTLLQSRGCTWPVYRQCHSNVDMNDGTRDFPAAHYSGHQAAPASLTHPGAISSPGRWSTLIQPPHKPSSSTPGTSDDAYIATVGTLCGL